MIISKIVLRNFKSYFGENEFTFKNGLNIISGSVGSGKTSLFEAFQWLIETRKDEFIESEFIINKAFEDESIRDEKTPVEVEVKLYFDTKDIDSNNVENILSKKLIYKKIEDDLIPNEPELFLEYIDQITGNTITDDNPSSIIRKIKSDFFPQNIREYILFKGENLNSLIDFNNSDTLRNAVDRISYLKYKLRLEQILHQIKEIKKLLMKQKMN